MTVYVEFEFDLPEALLVSLIKILDGLATAPLTAESLVDIPEVQGVYQLFLDDKLSYIGKTDADAGLHKRLTRHARKILHRKGLSASRVSFKAVRVFVFTAMDLEGDLIRHYGGVRALAWNGSGFGSNDPGRERDTTRVDQDNYDAIFPIDVDREIAFAIDKDESVATALARLKDALPYTFRYQTDRPRSRKPHVDFLTATLPALNGPVSTRRAISHILDGLATDWQATALPGYVILYKEAPRSYPQGEILALGGVK